MNRNHLSDMELQQAALQELALDASIQKHLQSCAQCLESVRNYQLLFNAIMEQETSAFTVDVQAVMQQVLAVPDPARATSFAWPFLIVAFFLVAVTVIVFWEQLANLFTGISGMPIYLIAITAIPVLVIWVLDLHRQHNRQLHLLNFS